MKLSIYSLCFRLSSFIFSFSLANPFSSFLLFICFFYHVLRIACIISVICLFLFISIFYPNFFLKYTEVRYAIWPRCLHGIIHVWISGNVYKFSQNILWKLCHWENLEMCLRSTFAFLWSVYQKHYFRLYTWLLTYLLTYLLHWAESFLRS